jgi:aerotaxis receptor
MLDMEPTQVEAPFRSVTLRYHDGSQRQVLVKDEEVPYPEGRLIVSRTDPKGVIVQANDSFVEVSGYSREELLGQPHHILRHPDMPRATFKDLWQTVEQGKVWHGYVKNLRRDGRHYWVYATVIPNVRQGRLVGYTSVRREPSRAKVREAEQHYETLRS